MFSFTVELGCAAFDIDLPYVHVFASDLTCPVERSQQVDRKLDALEAAMTQFDGMLLGKSPQVYPNGPTVSWHPSQTISAC